MATNAEGQLIINGQVVCLDCEQPLSPAAIARGGLRCRRDSNKIIANQRVARVEAQDGWLLEQAKIRPVSAIAKELGLTRQAVWVRINKAKERAANA